MQGGAQALLQACTRDDVAIAPLEVLRIEHLNHRSACIVAFSGTLKHLVLPHLTIRGAQELLAVVAALMLLQPASRSPFLQYSLLRLANSDLQWNRSHHVRLFKLNAAQSHLHFINLM